MNIDESWNSLTDHAKIIFWYIYWCNQKNEPTQEHEMLAITDWFFSVKLSEDKQGLAMIDLVIKAMMTIEFIDAKLCFCITGKGRKTLAEISS